MRNEATQVFCRCRTGAACTARAAGQRSTRRMLRCCSVRTKRIPSRVVGTRAVLGIGLDSIAADHDCRPKLLGRRRRATLGAWIGHCRSVCTPPPAMSVAARLADIRCFFERCEFEGWRRCVQVIEQRRRPPRVGYRAPWRVSNSSSRNDHSNSLPILATLGYNGGMDKGGSAASLLRDLRRREGRSLRLAAAELGVAPSQLSRMERGERPIGEEAAQRLSEYYSVPAELIALSRGQLPSDVIDILRAHPFEISRLREKYAG